MKTKKLLLLIAACMLLGACEKEKEKEEEPTLSVSENTITFPKDGGSRQIKVSSNAAWWDATVDAAWCSCFSYNDSGQITVTVEPNPMVTERTATITIQAGPGELQEQVSVIQEAGDVTLSVSENTITFPKSNREERDIEVTSNAAWNATVDATWCSIHYYSMARITITVEANPMVTERTATITIQAGALQEKITIVQEAETVITLSTTPALIYPETNASGTYSIDVTSNGAEWTTAIEYIYDPSWEYQDKTWCVLEPSSGVGSGVIAVNLPQNITHFRRSAIITITSGNLVQTATIVQHGIPVFENEGVTINGITWATKNVEGSGTFAYSSQDPGKYYQFNRIWGYSYIDGKIEPAYDFTDRFRESGDWLLINDPSPEGWRLPTAEELENLRTSGYRWESEIKGAWFGPDAQTATFGEPGNAIFLSANGALWNGDISTEQGEGQYWTKSNSPDRISQALRFGVWGSKQVNTPYAGINKGCGLSIRCVKE